MDEHHEAHLALHTFLRSEGQQRKFKRKIAAAYLRSFRFQRDYMRRTGRPGNVLQWTVATFMAYRMLHALGICRGVVAAIVDAKVALAIDLESAGAGSIHAPSFLGGAGFNVLRLSKTPTEGPKCP